MISLTASKSLRALFQVRIQKNRNVAKCFATSSSSFQGHYLDKQSMVATPVGNYIQHAKMPSRSFSSSAGISQKVKSIITSNKAVIFSKTYCPYCTATKRLFSRMGVDFEAVELDKLEDGHLIQIELYTLSGQRSVPNVFIGGNHLGGNDDTQAAARSGKLQKLLEES